MSAQTFRDKDIKIHPEHHQSIKLFSVKNGQNMSLLSFFPGVLVTEKDKGIYPAEAVKLELTDQSLFLDLSGRHARFSSFPAAELQGDQMVALAAQMSIASYPIK